jgi:transposase
MGKAVSIKKRWEIVFLHSHYLGPKLSKSVISKRLKVSPRVIDHWIKIYKETGDVQEKRKSGRKKITGLKEDVIIKSFSINNPEASSQQISEAMESVGIRASSTTIRRRLKSMGMKYCHPISKPLMLKRHRLSRVHFAKQNGDQDWKKVIFTDESTFQLFPNSRKLWMRKSKKLIYRKVKHPQKIHAWGGFSDSGFGKLITFTGILTSKRMIELYEDGLLPSSTILFDHDWILQEDNDPKHTSKVSKKWKDDNSIERMDWPSNSPDLNPMENLWRILKYKVANLHPKNLKELEVAIHVSWYSLPKKLAQKLVGSMPNRIQRVLEEKGDSIDY